MRNKTYQAKVQPGATTTKIGVSLSGDTLARLNRGIAKLRRQIAAQQAVSASNNPIYGNELTKPKRGKSLGGHYDPFWKAGVK